MSNRVGELAEQARQYARSRMGNTPNFKLYSAKIFQEKFAELVIKETMQVVANNVPSDSYVNAADAVIKHFGE